ncbi:MAG: phosphoribosylanthranilate isomerase [Desulfobacteraceae bacterium]|nr:phosphoribosylanthranilate isomerase [Desulfobacteraceae bacterium]MBC2755674.1 phosphoribosylanthranilate isomerase [Desulfobacteraceae bacterium]
METCLQSKLPQIKICGLTCTEEALKCASAGADAIGLVFFKKSPRYIKPEKAKTICAALPDNCTTVGVFVNEPFNSIMDIVITSDLGAVQLHGNEPPKFVRDLMDQGLSVIKGLYLESQPSIAQVSTYTASAYLVECAKGILPGGNAMTWNWENAAGFGENHPMVLAGGLSPKNVASAINKAMPDAVDVSSGVESAPGKKDIHRVKQFIKAVRGCTPQRELRRIF